MTILAAVSAALRHAIEDDPWLQGLDWRFEGAPDSRTELVILEGAQPESLLQSGNPPVWWFGPSPHCWDPPRGVDVFSRAPSLDGLRARLVVWLWRQGRAVPVGFSATPRLFSHGCGQASLALSQGRGRLELALAPLEGQGGDIALVLEDAQGSLLVLGDAIGHGLEAEMDALLFALAVLQHLSANRLDNEQLAGLDRFLRDSMADQRFVAATVLRVDWQARQLALVNAGMPEVVVRINGAWQARYGARRPAFGLGEPGHCDDAIQQAPLLPSSEWVLHSDGLDAGRMDRYWSETASHKNPGNGILRAIPSLSALATDDLADDLSCMVLTVACSLN